MMKWAILCYFNACFGVLYYANAKRCLCLGHRGNKKGLGLYYFVQRLRVEKDVICELNSLNGYM